MKTKNILKSTLAVVAVTASSFGAWKAYGTYGSVNNSLMMENIEALSQDGDNDTGGGHHSEPVYCKTMAFIASDGSNGGTFGGPLGIPKCYICSDGYAEFSDEGEKTCKRLQKPKCTSSVKMNPSQSTQSHDGYCIPK